MYLLVCLVGLFSLTWHTRGYAVDHATTFMQPLPVDDVDHIDPNPTPDIKEAVEEEETQITEEDIKAFILYWLGDEDYYYEAPRPKSNILESKTEVTTEHIVIPTDGKEHTTIDGDDSYKTDELQIAKDAPKRVTKDNPSQSMKLQEPVDAAKHTVKDGKKSDKPDELQLQKGVDRAPQTIKFVDNLEITPDIKEVTEEEESFKTQITEEDIKAFILYWLGDEDYYYDAPRPKRYILESKTKDNTEGIVTTEHVVIPTYGKEQTPIDENDSYKTDELKIAKDAPKRATKDEDKSSQSMKLQKDTAQQTIQFGNNSNKTEELLEIVDTIHHIFGTPETVDREFKEGDAIKTLFNEFEYLEHAIDEFDALLKLEDVYWSKEEEESLEEVERCARDSEWFDPIYPDYPWCPYWYPSSYPWGFYPSWSPPYHFYPYPVAFPANGGTCNNGASNGATTKQYIPVKGKVTIAASFTDGTWTLPASTSTSNIKGPCFYPENDCIMPVYDNNSGANNLDQGIRNYPAAKVFSTPGVQTIPVSGKAVTVAHFC